jgi:predicted nucleotidyltransferase
MKAVGIVAEYNPFHNGHAYQIQTLRQKQQPDVVVAVMSGNFLQRGEPAIVDKWTRSKMALAGGVDLVIELPVVFSTQPADFFAQGAIQIFKALGLDGISFGVETGTGGDFLKAAQWLGENEARLDQKIQDAEAYNVPYAQQMEEAILELAPEFPVALNSPNNQLGFAYVKEIVRQNLADKVEILPLQRKSAGYDDEVISKDATIASATAIRRAQMNGENIAPYIPAVSYGYFEEAQKQLVTWEDYFPYLKYQITVQPKEALREIYQMTEGLENRLKDNIQDAHTFRDFMQKIKTKRYTQTRLQRLLTYTLLQWPETAVLEALKSPKNLRVLGFTQAGQNYLSEIKRQVKLPLLTNVVQKNAKLLSFDLLAGNIYRLGKSHMIPKQDFTQKPIKFD